MFLGLSDVEKFLKALCGGYIVDAVPDSRIETYLNALLEGNTDVPRPLSRAEAYLYDLCKGGALGSGSVTAEILDNVLYIRRVD